MFTSPLYLVPRNPRSSGLGTIIYRSPPVTLRFPGRAELVFLSQSRNIDRESKYVLETSFFGAIGLAVVALLGYVAMVHFLGSGVSVSDPGILT